MIYFGDNKISEFHYGDTEIKEMYLGSALMYQNKHPFFLTLETDGHGTLTANTLSGYAGDTVALSTSYNTYYRFSGYGCTGGSIASNTFTFGNQDATAKAFYKPNAFTATGTFAYSNKTQTNNPTTGNYNATLKAFTGSKPSNWPATNANWKVSNASAYKLSWNTKVTMTAQNGTPTSTITGYTQLRIGGSNKNQVGANAGRLAKTITITNTGSNTTQGQPSLYCWNSAYYTSTTHGWTQCSPNGWTATGYAP